MPLVSIDEAASLHELLNPQIRKLFGDYNPRFLYFAWVIPGMLMVFLLAAIFPKFQLHLPAKTRRGFLIAAVLYIGGALGFELIEGYYHNLQVWEWPLNALITVEETCEMLGLIVFNWALMVYLAGDYKVVRVLFHDGPKEGTPGSPTE